MVTHARWAGARTGRYIRAFSWTAGVGDFVRNKVVEHPILHVCAGPVEDFGDVRVDRYVRPIPPAVIADWTELPFADDSFGCVFADPPWGAQHMQACADFCKEALRVAPVAYVMSPWLWTSAAAYTTDVWVRMFPGIKPPILLVRYQRAYGVMPRTWNSCEATSQRQKLLFDDGCVGK